MVLWMAGRTCEWYVRPGRHSRCHGRYCHCHAVLFRPTRIRWKGRKWEDAGGKEVDTHGKWAEAGGKWSNAGKKWLQTETNYNMNWIWTEIRSTPLPSPPTAQTGDAMGAYLISFCSLGKNLQDTRGRCNLNLYSQYLLPRKKMPILITKIEN